MREEYKIQRSGRTYVLYPGLLNEAIETELIADAREQPIVKATFTGRPEEDNFIQTSGIGTAGRATDRKGPAVDAPIEMAETRAKARALRDAVNVGETAFEELSEQSEQESESSAFSATGPVQPSTLGRLRFLATTYSEELGRDPEEHIEAFEKEVGPLEDLSEAQATVWIRRYESGLDKLESEANAQATEGNPR